MLTDNGHKLKQERFWVYIRKKFFTIREGKHWNAFLERLCSFHLWRFSKPNWRKPWGTWSVPFADPALSKQSYHGPPEALSNLNYAMMVLWLHPAWLLKNIQGWRLNNISGQPVPMIVSIHAFCLLLSCHTWLRRVWVCLLDTCLPCKYQKVAIRLLLSLPQAKQARFPQYLFLAQALVPSHFHSSSLNLLRFIDFFFLHWETQNWMQYSGCGLMSAKHCCVMH